VEDFADWLRQTRGVRSQASLATAARELDAEAAIGPNRISEWENRHSLPSLRQLVVTLLVLEPESSEASRARRLWEQAQLKGLPIDRLSGLHAHTPTFEDAPTAV
jgi:hypothetical protein